MPRESDPPPLSEQRPIQRNKPIVLLALPSRSLSQLVGALLGSVEVEVVQVVDDEALERYLFARHRAAPAVVVWHVALASLAALDAAWRAYREGRGARLVLVRETRPATGPGATGAPESQRSPESGPIPGRLIYVQPDAAAIVEAVMLLLDQTENTRLRDDDEPLREDEPLLATGG